MTERARALGGTLILTSEPGRGTELRLELPVAARRMAG
jgi:signal transduction histidine kinase